MLVPVPDDDATTRRRPWLCLALALVWAGIHAAALAGVGPAPERFGLAPDAPALPGAATFFALHVHLPHLMLSLALLLLAVAPLECRWGPLFTGAVGALLLALGGAATVLLVNGSERPLLGPSVALTGLAAASIVRFVGDGLRFEVPFAVRGGRRPGFHLPAPAIAGVWFVGEVVLEVLSDVSGPTRGAHPGAHAAAAVAGAACAWGVARAGLEGGALRPRASARRDRATEATLARARAARDEERPDAALDELAAAVAASPRDARLVAALWETACAAGRRDAARKTALRFVAEAWRRGEREAAGRVWRAVLGAEPDAPLDVRLRLALAPALHEAGHRVDAARTLHTALAEPALTPGTALRIAELARGIHPATGVAAARRALATEGLDETKRARIEALIATLEAEPANLEDLDLGVPTPDAAPGGDPHGAETPLEAEGPELGLAERAAGDDAPGAGDETPEDPHALRLDEPEEAAPALELGADGSLGVAEEDVTFGAVDLAGDDADPPPEPVAAPPLAGAPGSPGTDRDPAARPLPPRSAERAAPAEAPDAAAEAPDPGALDPAALDLAAAAPGAEHPDVADLAGPPEPRFGAAKVIEAVPRALRDEALEVASEGGGTSRLPLARVEAVAVAGVRDLGAKPVIVIDLLFNWSDEDGGPLKVARLRSDRFDARTLADAGTPVEAVRALVAALIERSGALALPDPDAARGRPFALHDTLAAYEREVLLVGS